LAYLPQKNLKKLAFFDFFMKFFLTGSQNFFTIRSEIMRGTTFAMVYGVYQQLLAHLPQKNPQKMYIYGQKDRKLQSVRAGNQ